jgi:hypothetical protein
MSEVNPSAIDLSPDVHPLLKNPDGSLRKFYRGAGELRAEPFWVSEKGTFGRGIYFTGDPSYANIYARGDAPVMQCVNLNIKNPFIMTHENGVVVSSNNEALAQLVAERPNWIKTQENTDRIIAEGYDGIFINPHDSQEEVIVFDRQQISYAHGVKKITPTEVQAVHTTSNPVIETPPPPVKPPTPPNGGFFEEPEVPKGTGVAAEVEEASVISKLLSNKKLLKGLGVAGAVGIGVAAISSRSKRGRKKTAEEREHVQNAAFFSGAASLGVSHFFKDQELARAVRLGGFFGGTLALGTASDTKKYGFGKAAAINTLAVGAGILAFSLTKTNQKPLYDSLKTLLANKGGIGIATKIEEVYAKVTNNFPQLKLFFTEDTLAMGVAMGTIPFSHAVIKRALITHHRKNNGREEQAIAGSMAESNAGMMDNRMEMSGIYGSPHPGMPHSGVNMNTKVTERMRRHR